MAPHEETKCKQCNDRNQPGDRTSSHAVLHVRRSLTDCGQRNSQCRNETVDCWFFLLFTSRFTVPFLAALASLSLSLFSVRRVETCACGGEPFLSSPPQKAVFFIHACLFCSQRRCAVHGAMSYYINGPRIFTPSTFKQSKQFLPMESFGSTVEQAKEQPPNPINTCHRARFANLQHTHPSTWRSAFPLLNQQTVASLLPLALA